MNTEEQREKVIKGLECCVIHINCTADGGCPYNSQANANCLNAAIKDALALMKAQEPVEPTLDIRYGKSMWRCGSCSTALQPNQMNAKFCFNCGRMVMWH